MALFLASSAQSVENGLKEEKEISFKEG